MISSEKNKSWPNSYCSYNEHTADTMINNQPCQDKYCCLTYACKS